MPNAFTRLLSSSGFSSWGSITCRHTTPYTVGNPSHPLLLTTSTTLPASNTLGSSQKACYRSEKKLCRTIFINRFACLACRVRSEDSSGENFGTIFLNLPPKCYNKFLRNYTCRVVFPHRCFPSGEAVLMTLHQGWGTLNNLGGFNSKSIQSTTEDCVVRSCGLFSLQNLSNL